MKDILNFRPLIPITPAMIDRATTAILTSPSRIKPEGRRTARDRAEHAINGCLAEVAHASLHGIEAVEEVWRLNEEFTSQAQVTVDLVLNGIKTNTKHSKKYTNISVSSQHRRDDVLYVGFKALNTVGHTVRGHGRIAVATAFEFSGCAWGSDKPSKDKIKFVVFARQGMRPFSEYVSIISRGPEECK